MNYTRTQAGTAAVLNPKIEIPRPMKALLISMIGGFDADLYASRLRDEQDVPAMLDALVRAGYIRALPDTGSPLVERVEGQAGRLAPQPARLAPQPARLVPQSERLSAVSESESVSHRPLQDAIADITGFAMSYLPNDALEIAFAMEGVTSFAQLEATLGGYEMKIRHLGAIADQHLAKVKRLLGHV